MENYDTEFMSEKEINQLIQKEMDYRQKHGDTYSADENLCKYCRNIDKQNHFCWDCDSGSKYIPITRPLFNLCLMFLSLNSALEEAEGNLISQQKGMIEALRFVMQPFGLNNVATKFKDEIMNNEKDYHTPLTLAEIEKAKVKNIFKQSKENKKEIEYRKTVGTIRCHENACAHCKYNDRFGTEFCWDCDRGTNFKNGIRSIQTIEKMLMFLNTQRGEVLLNHEADINMTMVRIGLAEGLKWIIEPYITEEELFERNDFEYVSKEDINSTIKMEDEEYVENELPKDGNEEISKKKYKDDPMNILRDLKAQGEALFGEEIKVQGIDF
ncbi:hypothetical protein AGMMS49944_18380 [Spirochaetia bacterium]|nr:hypothetical protein AGMMS49944_18380 [Spirochaetia bacterium]